MPIKLIEKTLIYVAERKSFVNEGELRDALCKNLNDQYHTTGWWWGVEEKFKTDCLENIQEIKFDIIGIRQSNGESEAFLIELKYVPVNIETGRPNDTPAFAYDLFKNCVKIELAMGGRATGKNQFSKISGITLGITNYSKYWNKNGNFDNWATNFLNAINPLANKDIILHGVINTIAKNSEFTTIYDQERCHISLGLRWKSEWIDLKGSHEGYRFLIIKPINNDFDYQHSKLNSDTIPFLDLNAKNKYQQIIKNGRSEFIQNYSERFIMNNSSQQIQAPEPMPTLKTVALAIVKICRNNMDVFAPSLLRRTMGVEFPNTEPKMLNAQIQPHLRYLRTLRAVEFIPTHQKRNRPHRVINRDLLLDIGNNGESILPTSNPLNSDRDKDVSDDEGSEDIDAITDDDKINQMIEMEQRIISLEATVDSLVAKLNALGVILRP